MPFNPRTLLKRLRNMVAATVTRLINKVPISGPYTDTVTGTRFRLYKGRLMPLLAGASPDDDDDDDEDKSDKDNEDDEEENTDGDDKDDDAEDDKDDEDDE